MPGLYDIVKAYQEGQEVKVKKAREIAQKQAEEFERQYKVQQQQLETRRIDSQIEQAQKQFDLDQKTFEEAKRYHLATEFDKERKNKITELKAAIMKEIAQDRNKLNDRRWLEDRISKTMLEWAKGGMSPSTAEETARMAQAEIRDAVQGIGGQQQSEPAPAVGPWGGLLNMLQQRGQPMQQQGASPNVAALTQSLSRGLSGPDPMHRIAKPLEGDAGAMHNPLPEFDRKKALAESLTASRAARQELDKANAEVARATIKDREQKLAAEARIASAKAKVELEKGEQAIAETKARTAVLLQQAARSREDARIAREKFAFEKDKWEKDLKAGGGKSADAAKSISAAISKLESDKTDLQDKYGKAAVAVAEMESHLDRNYMRKLTDKNGNRLFSDARIEKIIEEDKPALAHQRAMKESLYRGINQNEGMQADLRKKLKENGKVTLSNGNGKPLEGKTKAAAEADARAAAAHHRAAVRGTSTPQKKAPASKRKKVFDEGGVRAYKIN